MPFRTVEWVNGDPIIGSVAPDPELRQTDALHFLILKSFCYVVPPEDGEPETAYVVPGVDAPLSATTTRLVDNGVSIVIPPNDGAPTDLASVPSPLWWLIASYGNHTLAALLHDSLYVEGTDQPVPRPIADGLFLRALREQEQAQPDEHGQMKKPGIFRHWLMWAAVSAFGHSKGVGLLFCGHVVAVWGLVVGGALLAWGGGLEDMKPWEIPVAVVGGIVAILVYLGFLGFAWRLGVDRTGWWMLPSVVLGATIVVPLFFVEGTAMLLFLIAAGLAFAGLVGWGFIVDPALRWWLWPTAVTGLPIAVVPVILIYVAKALVLAIDFGAYVALVVQGKAEGVERPSFKGGRLSI